MDNHRRTRHGVLTRSATGPSAAEAFILIAIATILITRLYLQLTGYPQVGGGNLHIAHALYGGALMMLALLIGWMTLGFAARILAVVLGGIGFGLFLDEVGKFVTKDNDYFYGPAAEIMYILVVVILVGARMVRAFKPLTPQECLASAAAIAADGVARGLADHRRQIALELVEEARAGGADRSDIRSVRALLMSADHAPDRLYRLQRWVPRLIPDFFRSPRWVPVVGWLLVAGALAGVLFGALGIALGGYLYEHGDITLRLDGGSPAAVILLISAALTFGDGAAGDDRPATNRRRLAAALAAQRRADLHLPQCARRFRHRGFRGAGQHVDRPVHAGDPVLSTRCRGPGIPAKRRPPRRRRRCGLTGLVVDPVEKIADMGEAVAHPRLERPDRGDDRQRPECRPPPRTGRQRVGDHLSTRRSVDHGR